MLIQEKVFGMVSDSRDRSCGVNIYIYIFLRPRNAEFVWFSLPSDAHANPISGGPTLQQISRKFHHVFWNTIKG